MAEASDTSSARDWSDTAVAEHILRGFGVWAVIGCSSNPMRPSHGVSRFLVSRGYTVVPINPRETTVHGQQAYPDLRSAAAGAAEPIEVVDIFRRSDLVLPHVEEAIEVGAKAIWMQLGVWNQEAARLAKDEGLLVVMNRCPAIDHPRMVGGA
ncbi:MAG: CoA-binding protein [Candidatus Limnocylindria bacterium]